jgi:tetratricopeptide (TPR) repeat protein
VSILIVSLLSTLLLAEPANPPRSQERPASKAPSVQAYTAEPEDPVEKAYEKLLDDDDQAQREADHWIREAQAFKAKGVPYSEEALHERIEQRFAPIRKAYQDFLQQHPKHVQARLAYGSFLYETQDEDEGVAQWEKAREIDPRNPAAWNNLANHFGHRGPVSKAFGYYEKAMELKPDEAVYFQNLATTVYLFRKDAMEHYHIDEKHVFDKALDLYRQALKIDPQNFPLATDYAQTYYGIKPLRTQEALAAWNYALKIANDDFERQGVYVHLARVEISSGRFQEARNHLNQVTNSFYNVLKGRLSRNLTEKEKNGTNAPPSQTVAPEPMEEKALAIPSTRNSRGDLPLPTRPKQK